MILSEKTIQILIYFHAAMGGLGLLSGSVALFASKGNQAHRKSGLVFFFSMLLSGLTALIITVLPDHENPFLMAIGIFSLYFVLSGFRALKYKSGVQSFLFDKLIAYTMLLTAFLMVVVPLIVRSQINVVLVVFAVIGAILSFRDLRIIRHPERLKKAWLKLHLGKMIGGYIAATTAFIVVNQLIPGIYGWFVPSLLGGWLIRHWFQKLGTKAS